MLNSESVPVPLTERFDAFIQSTPAVAGAVAGLFVIALLAMAVSHLGSDTRGRPR